MALHALRDHRRPLRRLTMGIAPLGCVLAGMTFELLPGIGVLLRTLPRLGMALLFGVPTLLAIGAFLGALADWPGPSSPAIAGLSLIVLWTVAASAWTLATPTPGGGVFFGFHLIAIAVVALSVAIGLREGVRRARASPEP